MVSMAARYDAVSDTYASPVDDYAGEAVSVLLDLVGPRESESRSGSGRRSRSAVELRVRLPVDPFLFRLRGAARELFVNPMP